jgi:hypothetical protein
MTKIAEAVLKVMSQVGYVQKKGVNSFQNYKYASIEGILEKIQPALVDCGLVIVQSEISHEIVAEGNLMEAVYEFTLHHSSGETSTPIRQTGLSSLRNSKGGYDDKALNKCHTTARKYFILGLFQIPTGLADDADAEEDKPAAAPVRPTPPRDPIPAAKSYVDEAIKAIGTLTDAAGLNAWVDANKTKLERLRDVYDEGSRQVSGAILETRRTLMKGAAE